MAVLDEDRYRANARRLAVAIAEELRTSDVVAELERIGRREGAVLVAQAE